MDMNIKRSQENSRHPFPWPFLRIFIPAQTLLKIGARLLAYFPLFDLLSRKKYCTHEGRKKTADGGARWPSIPPLVDLQLVAKKAVQALQDSS